MYEDPHMLLFKQMVIENLFPFLVNIDQNYKEKILGALDYEDADDKSETYYAIKCAINTISNRYFDLTLEVFQ